MGNHQSTVCDEHMVDKIQPLILMGRKSKHSFRCSNRGQKIYREAVRAEKRASSSISPWLHSFLNLPPNVRRRIYVHLLVLDQEIRLMPSQVTRVPGIALLQTCHQLHDEATAVFFAANTFRCYIRKIVPAQRASTDQPQYPAIRARLDSRTLGDALNISGGIMFPASRYHQHLTHLIIHLEIMIAHFEIPIAGSPMLTFAKPERENGMTQTDMEQMHRKIQDELLRVYGRIKGLWREKDGPWSGRLVIPERTSWTSEMVYEIDFEAVNRDVETA